MASTNITFAPASYTFFYSFLQYTFFWRRGGGCTMKINSSCWWTNHMSQIVKEFFSIQKLLRNVFRLSWQSHVCEFACWTQVAQQHCESIIIIIITSITTWSSSHVCRFITLEPIWRAALQKELLPNLSTTVSFSVQVNKAGGRKVFIFTNHKYFWF